MRAKEASEKAKSQYGDHAFADIPIRQMPTVGILVGEERIVFGTGMTFEEAFTKADNLVTARTQVAGLFNGLGYARINNDRCEVGVMLYGEHAKLASAGTFEEAFKRAANTAAGKNTHQLLDVVDATLKRFGSTAKVVINDYANCLIMRNGTEVMGVGCTFQMAFERAVEKDEAALNMSRRRNFTPQNDRKPAPHQHSGKPSGKFKKPFKKPWNRDQRKPIVAAKPEAGLDQPLELNRPAMPSIEGADIPVSEVPAELVVVQ